MSRFEKLSHVLCIANTISFGCPSTGIVDDRQVEIEPAIGRRIPDGAVAEAGCAGPTVTDAHRSGINLFVNRQGRQSTGYHHEESQQRSNE